MEIGTVKFFDDKKGYGFIQPDGGGSDIFVHYTGIMSGHGRRTLKDAIKVKFDRGQGPKGEQAINVTAA